MHQYSAAKPTLSESIALTGGFFRWRRVGGRCGRLETPHVLLASLLSAEASAVVGRNLAGGGIKVAVWSHGFVHRISTEAPDIQLRMRDFVNREADMIVCIARGEVGEFLRHTAVPRQKIAMIHNPVVTPDLPALAAQKPRHPWLLNNRLKVVIAAGRLDQVKDFPTLLRAFARLADKKLRLVVLGEGGQRLTLENLARELGAAKRIDFPGWTPNPLAFMSRAALFVLSSRNECLPTVLIEALACGCPVVSTDCPSGPAEILQGGETGPLVPVGDHIALADAMARTIDNPPDKRKLLARAGFFSVENSVNIYESLILGNQMC